jgi:septum site-determining protein MinC
LITSVALTQETLQAACHRLVLPTNRHIPWQDTLADQLSGLEGKDLELDSREWLLNCRVLSALQAQLEERSCRLLSIKSCHPLTVVSANALGIPAQLTTPQRVDPLPESAEDKRAPALLIHRATLRSGDHLKARHHVLLIGDVNPGAQISAGGNVLIWGRLRGSAHAGVQGDLNARITALQLRPLQLRIADLVARGPEEKPQPGLAEEARIVDGVISIEPADPRTDLSVQELSADLNN